MVSNKNLTRAALLLALTLLFQSLRFIIPIPVFFSTFLIGSLVNTCLLVAAEMVGQRSAFFIAAVAPMVAYFQQLLPLPVFIGPIAIGNMLYIELFWLGLRWGRWQRVGLAAVGKAAFMYIAFTWLLTFIAIAPKIAAGLMFVMSWPQLITGIIGGILAIQISRRLKAM